MSIGEDIRRDIATRQRRTVEITHPEVGAYTITYRVPTDRSEVAPILKRAEMNKKEAGLADASILALCCLEIRRLGELVADEDGNPVTFRDKQLQEWVGAASSRDAVRALYGSDGYVTTVANRLLEEAGYGKDDEVLVEDPTSQS
jgi:hypothetical protein